MWSIQFYSDTTLLTGKPTISKVLLNRDIAVSVCVLFVEDVGCLVHEGHVFNSAEPGKEFLAIELTISVGVNALYKLPAYTEREGRERKRERERFELRKGICKIENDDIEVANFEVV